MKTGDLVTGVPVEGWSGRLVLGILLKKKTVKGKTFWYVFCEDGLCTWEVENNMRLLT